MPISHFTTLPQHTPVRFGMNHNTPLGNRASGSTHLQLSARTRGTAATEQDQALVIGFRENLETLNDKRLDSSSPVLIVQPHNPNAHLDLEVSHYVMPASERSISPPLEVQDVPVVTPQNIWSQEELAQAIRKAKRRGIVFTTAGTGLVTMCAIPITNLITNYGPLMNGINAGALPLLTMFGGIALYFGCNNLLEWQQLAYRQNELESY